MNLCKLGGGIGVTDKSIAHNWSDLISSVEAFSSSSSESSLLFCSYSSSICVFVEIFVITAADRIFFW